MVSLVPRILRKVTYFCGGVDWEGLLLDFSASVVVFVEVHCFPNKRFWVAVFGDCPEYRVFFLSFLSICVLWCVSASCGNVSTTDLLCIFKWPEVN